jgi:hypothetical protein
MASDRTEKHSSDIVRAGMFVKEMASTAAASA